MLIESLHERRLPNLLHLSAKATPPNENENKTIQLPVKLLLSDLLQSSGYMALDLRL